ncbi:MAG: hypothetical protein HN833_00825, partial [Elusimicrobiaceae bacterium]|nr:hypothetical protein [Elusimicrobiaceae bacterium]
KKIIILTISLLVMAGNINATPVINELVNTKVSQAEAIVVNSAPVPPVIPPRFFKGVYKVFKEFFNKNANEVASKMFSKYETGKEYSLKGLLKESNAETFVFEYLITKGLMDKGEGILKKYLLEALAFAFYKEIDDIGIKNGSIAIENLDLIGKRIFMLINRRGEDCLSSVESIKNMEFLLKGSFEHKTAMDLLLKVENKNITLAELVKKVKIEMKAEIASESKLKLINTE